MQLSFSPTSGEIRGIISLEQKQDSSINAVFFISLEGMWVTFKRSAVSFANFWLLCLVPRACGSLLKHRLKMESITEVQPLRRSGT